MTSPKEEVKDAENYDDVIVVAISLRQILMHFSFFHTGARRDPHRTSLGFDRNVSRVSTERNVQCQQFYREQCQRAVHIYLQRFLDLLYQLNDFVCARYFRDRTRPNGGDAKVTTETSFIRTRSWRYWPHTRTTTHLNIGNLCLC